MSTLEQLPFHALTPRQQAVLAAMDVDLYQRRRLPPVALADGTLAAVWSPDDGRTPLAGALARAAGTVDVAQWCREWQAAGLSLPDLAQLRASPAAKRSFWRLLRARLR